MDYEAIQAVATEVIRQVTREANKEAELIASISELNEDDDGLIDAIDAVADVFIALDKPFDMSGVDGENALIRSQMIRTNDIWAHMQAMQTPRKNN